MGATAAAASAQLWEGTREVKAMATRPENHLRRKCVHIVKAQSVTSKPNAAMPVFSASICER